MRHGADAVMLFHGQGSGAADELDGACAALNQGGLPFLIDYDGKSIEMDRIAALAASCSSLVALKYGLANLNGWRQMRDALPPNLPLIFGGGDDLAPGFSGAAAFTSSVAN